MSLKQKTVSGTLRQPPLTGDGTSSGKRGSRWLGLLFVALGALAMALAAGDALAGVGSGVGDALRGSGSGERLGGSAGDDVVHGFAGEDSLFGGEGDDELYGGAGRDVLLGGGGDDFIEAKDGVRDYVDCGPGQDVASVDGGGNGEALLDRVAPNCETVYPG